MTRRKPQINLQVEPAMKALYEETKACGHRATRLCAAGLLIMVESPRLRLQALNRLRNWEARHAAASSNQIRSFVQQAQAEKEGSVGVRTRKQSSRRKRQ